MIRTGQLRLSRTGQVLGTVPELGQANLVLLFGSGGMLRDPAPLKACQKMFPDALLVGCSTAGSILGTTAFDDAIAVTAVHFEHTQIRMTAASTASGSRTAGQQVAQALVAPDLVHVLVLSEGLQVNGTELIEGLVSALPPHVAVTGGLAGDGERMTQTVVVAGENVLREQVIGVGFYGSRLKVGHGCQGGWGPLGPEREITRSQGNYLYELDGQSALELYRLYLGDHAAGLPATGLLFPLQIRPPEGGASVVRTLLGVDNDAGSIRFAGEMPQGNFARLMTASFGRLVDGAQAAAEQAVTPLGGSPELTLLVSCVGRRMLMRQRSDEELEAVCEVADSATVAGFYSYGELCPTGQRGCEMHNQTMTITSFRES